MNDKEKSELESIANRIDEIADGITANNMLRARQLRQVVTRVIRIARNEPEQAS